jgi:hypothetical protein
MKSAEGLFLRASSAGYASRRTRLRTNEDLPTRWQADLASTDVFTNTNEDQVEVESGEPGNDERGFFPPSSFFLCRLLGALHCYLTKGASTGYDIKMK